MKSLLLAAVSIASLSATAAQTTAGTNTETITLNDVECTLESAGDGEGKKKIKSSCCPTGDVVIPSNRNIVRIGEGAFEGCQSITKITLPEGLTNIEFQSFYGATALAEIVFPTTLKSVGYGALGSSGLTALDLSHTQISYLGAGVCYGCQSLERVDLADTRILMIPDHAFENCGSLSDVTLPPSLQVINENAFADSGVTDIDFPATLAEIGYRSFLRTPLTSAHLDHTMLHTIGEGAFTLCANLHTVSLPRFLQTIERNAFDTTSALTFLDLSHTQVNVIKETAFAGSGVQSIKLPDVVTTILSAAFQFSALQNITFPPLLELIYENAFENTQLTSVDMSQSNIVLIAQLAFSDCLSLTEVTLPPKVAQIDGEIFKSSKNLQTVYMSDALDEADIHNKDGTLFTLDHLLYETSKVKTCREAQWCCNFDYCGKTADGECVYLPMRPNPDTFVDQCTAERDDFQNARAQAWIDEAVPQGQVSLVKVRMGSSWQSETPADGARRANEVISTYAPCEGKAHGDPCTQCDPNAADCQEDGNFRVCHVEGIVRKCIVSPFDPSNAKLVESFMHYATEQGTYTPPSNTCDSSNATHLLASLSAVVCSRGNE